MYSQRVLLASVFLLVALTGFKRNPLDLTFEKYGKLPKSKREAIFESLSGENQLNLKVAVKRYFILNQISKLDRKTLWQLCAEGKAIREEMDEYIPQ